jgi:hypothetical protein
MPSMDDFLNLARKVAESHGIDAPEQFYDDLSNRTRREWPGERIYLVPVTSREDQSRSKAIQKAARTLPPGIISERMGISRQLISYHLKKGGV